MNDGHHIIALLEVGAGVILGFVVWSFVSPMISNMSATPTA